MAISFEALMNAGQKIKQPVNNLFNLLTNKETPEMTPIQLDTEGRIDPQASLDLAQQITPRTPSEHVFGRTLTADENTFNPETGEAELKTYSNTRPGFLTGLAAGMQENYNNDFSIDNLRPNNKGIGHRIGEGLGSLAKILATTGGDAWVAGNQGLDKAIARQNIRTNNQLYRNALEQQGVDTSNIRGYIGDEAFKSMLTGQQLKDNAEYRNMLLQTQMKNQEIANQMAREKLDYQQKQDAIKNMQEWEKINNDKNKGNTVTFNQITSLRTEFARLPAIKSANEIKRQFDNVTNTYNAYKNGKLKANAADQAMITTLNKILDPTSVVRESEFARTAAGQSIFARMEGLASKLAKGGGGLTDAEREDLYTAMQEMYEANQAEANAYIQSYTDLANRYGINPADIMPRQYYVSETSQQKTYPEGTIIKNKQGQRMIMRGGQWQAM